MVCATAWLSIHKLKEMFRLVIMSIAAITWASLVLNLLLHGFAILVYKFSTWWPHTSGDQENEFYDVEKTIKFAANKQVDNLYYIFLFFILTWEPEKYP